MGAQVACCERYGTAAESATSDGAQARVDDLVARSGSPHTGRADGCEGDRREREAARTLEVEGWAWAWPEVVRQERKVA